MEKQFEEVLYLTEEGYQEYLSQIELLKTEYEVKLSKVSDNRVGDPNWEDDLRAMGSELLIQKAALEAKIAGLKRIEIIDEVPSASKVNIGDYVTIRMSHDVSPLVVKLIGDAKNDNSDLNAGFISITPNSPVGKAIFTKEVGSLVPCEINGTEVIIEIMAKADSFLPTAAELAHSY